MQIISDLQLHSKYSRAVSPDMNIAHIAAWAKQKGINLLATGDWTHPLWLAEIKRELEEIGHGLLKLKATSYEPRADMPFFLLATEISCIYSQAGRVRKIHILVWVPSVASAEKINSLLLKRGANLSSDGRPIIGLTSQELTDIVLTAEPNALIIPAHAWTPHFSVFGSESGFDSLEECFGPYTKYIYAIETGLSSDPAMNWRIKELDTRSIVSFSDAHSGAKLGREATVFEISDLNYLSIYKAITSNQQLVTSNQIAYTVEFYPEEGKYHYTGHRACNIKHSPAETKKFGTTCPTCGKKLTIGVMHRVENIAGRSHEDLRVAKRSLPETQVSGIYSTALAYRPPYVMLVPLHEILAEALGSTPASQKVAAAYTKLTDHFAGEFNVLLCASITDIQKIAGERVGEGIGKVRAGEITIDPGFDGLFGKVKIWGEKEKLQNTKEQLGLF